MYNLLIASLASNGIDGLTSVINRACGACWVRASALASDRARLIEMPAYTIIYCFILLSIIYNILPYICYDKVCSNAPYYIFLNDIFFLVKP